MNEDIDADLIAEIERRERLREDFSSMSEWERTRFMRFALRIVNHDPKAERLAALHEAGKISRHELLARM
ncbi:MAG: hypothetical protein AMXMBFR31_08900 [Candidatus Desulfobacillus denitrificans]